MGIKLSLPEKAKLAKLAASDFKQYVDWGRKDCPSQQSYELSCSPNPDFSDLRIEAFNKLATPQTPITKLAFDTRRIDPKARNPRGNLQNWKRSAPFVTNDDKEKLGKFGKVFIATKELKTELEGQQGWFDSFARLLYDTLHRTLRKKQGTVEISQPQFSYLEQLLFNRYRISMEDVESLSNSELQKRILSKDEELLEQAQSLRKDGKIPSDLQTFSKEIKEESASAKEIVNNLFKKITSGNGTRTITITISNQEVK